MHRLSNQKHFSSRIVHTSDYNLQLKSSYYQNYSNSILLNIAKRSVFMLRQDQQSQQLECMSTNKIKQMEKSRGMDSTFITHTRSNRPKTSYISRNKSLAHEQLLLDPEVDPIAKIKTYKHEIKKLEQEYQVTLARLNESKKIIDKQYRDSQKKKVQFLNLYENRKLKLFEQKLLDEKEEVEVKHKHSLREKAKTMKLNSEIRGLLLKNQLEETQADLCLKNKQDKQKLKQRLSKTKEKHYEQARVSFSRIKQEEGELQQRRKKMNEMQMMIAKQNYLKKIGSELQFIQNYDKMLNQICDDSPLCEGCTGDTKSGFFLTQKKD